MAFVSGVVPLQAASVGRPSLCGARRVAAPAPAVGRCGVRMTTTDTPSTTKAADEAAAAAARHAEAEKHAAGVTFDNEENDSKTTRLTVTGNDRPGLLDALTAALNSCGVTVLRAVVSTRDDGMVNDVFTVVRGDKKLRSEDVNTVRRQVMAVLNEEPSSSSQSQARAQSLHANGEAPALGDQASADPREAPASVYLDHTRGVSVLADNGASPDYTTFTINAPDAPNLVSRVLQNFGYLNLNVRFAAMSSYNDEGVFRHDVYHLTGRNGKQVEEGVKEELRNNIFFMITSPGLDDVRLRSLGGCRGVAPRGEWRAPLAHGHWRWSRRDHCVFCSIAFVCLSTALLTRSAGHPSLVCHCHSSSSRRLPHRTGFVLDISLRLPAKRSSGRAPPPVIARDAPAPFLSFLVFSGKCRCLGLWFRAWNA